jgi:DNA-binding response OmpR family regulator
MAAALEWETRRFLPGEDLGASTAGEVAGWIVIYEEMVSVISSVIARAGDGAEAAALRDQLPSIEARLAAWRDRHAQSSGVVVDEGRLLSHEGKTVRLTRREVELLEFLLRHPRRQFTSKELARQAWRNPWLSDAQVRTYLMRLRRRLSQVGLDGVANLARSRGYGIGRLAADSSAGTTQA